MFKQNNTEHQFSVNLKSYLDEEVNLVQMSVINVRHKLLNNSGFIILSLIIRLALSVLLLKIK